VPGEERGVNARGRPRVLTVPAGAPFLATLADALISGRVVTGFPDPADPLGLARAVVLLPTRRACRAFHETLAERGGPALLLPRIRPIGDVDEDELALDAGVEPAEPALDIPPAVHPFERRLRLTRLVAAWLDRLAAETGRARGSAAEAAHLAAELGRVMDMVATEGVPWSALEKVLPAELQAHWAITLDFLKIATDYWPAELAERGLVDAAERRRALVEAEAARLARHAGPVIAAGSTGSIPSTAALLDTIARLPHGAVVLPGLDLDLDEATWNGLLRAEGATADPAPSHPQTAMRALLDRMDELRRDEVETLGPAPAGLRGKLLSEALRPAESTPAWAELRENGVDLAPGLDGVALVEAANEQEEALAVAALLRQAVEDPGATAALVTPDRGLARRVCAELARFGVAADDSSGRPLAETPAGVLVRLVAETARGGFEPVDVAALLKHPLAAFGQDPAELRRGARALERAALRGPRPGSGAEGIARALEAVRATPAGRKRTNAAAGLRSEDFAQAEAALAALAGALGPLAEALAPRGRRPAAGLAQRLLDAVEAAAARADGRDGFAGDDGRALRLFFAEWLDADDAGLAVDPGELPEFMLALMAGRTVRPARDEQPRVRILGLLEARLVAHDLVVLGGLNEGVWPAATRTDPWLSRTMRADMALPVPERRIGLAAHDFAQALASPRAAVTRALKAGGAPTVPSRWLQRLAAVAGKDAMDAARARGDETLALVRALDRAEGEPRPIPRPEPRPPVAARPRRLSVTRVETLVRDPYSIYAQRVLRLDPFEAIAEPPGAAERGTLIHDALNRFVEAVDRGGPVEEDALLAVGREVFAGIAALPELHAFWWPRFTRVARWYVGFEAGRRASGARIASEIAGELALALPGGPFTLTARADRIEQRGDGAFAVLDFKTGRAPSQKEVAVGFAPQLPLEAAIAMHGGFAGFAKGLTPAELTYVSLSGRDPPGCEMPRKPPEGETLEQFVARSLARLRDLLAKFDDPAVGYRSLAASQFRLRYGDYDHLARVKEWGLVGEPQP
jgi:ATP-dependent helicase/nuclease subunit B